MQTTPKSYTDIDYESFPIADLTLDRHWIQLPTAVLLERQKARRAAQHQERLAALPEDHKIILVPADPLTRRSKKNSGRSSTAPFTKLSSPIPTSLPKSSPP